MKKTMNTPICSSIDEQPRKLTHAQIRDMYFDSVMDIFLSQKYRGNRGWVYDYETPPEPRGKAGFVRVMVLLKDGGSTFLNVNVKTLMDNKASKDDVLFFVESKTNRAKQLFEYCLNERTKATGMVKVDVSNYPTDVVEECVQLLLNAGINACAGEDAELYVSAESTGGDI